MSTLADLTLSLARKITDVIEGTATGGSTTTLIDTSQLTSFADDYFIAGTVWFLSTTLSGVTATISDSVQSTGTLTFATQSATASGVRYALANEKFRRSYLRQFINSALRDIRFPKVDDTLTIVLGTTEYVLPTGVDEVLEISRKAYSGTYARQYNWRQIAGKLYFDKAPDGALLRLIHNGQHAELTADTDVITIAGLNQERLVWEAAVYAWRWMLQMYGKDNPLAGQMLTEAKTNADAIAQAQQLSNQEYTAKLQQAQAMAASMPPHQTPQQIRQPRATG